MYTDGSRQNHDFGVGVYIAEMEKKLNFQFSEDCNIEISIINRTENWLRYHKIYGKDMTIVTESISVIKSVTDLVHKCRASVIEIWLKPTSMGA